MDKNESIQGHIDAMLKAYHDNTDGGLTSPLGIQGILDAMLASPREDRETVLHRFESQVKAEAHD